MIVPRYIRHVFFSGFGDIVEVVKDICPGRAGRDGLPAYFLAVIVHCVGDSYVDYSSDVVTDDRKVKCDGHKKYAVDTCFLH